MTFDEGASIDAEYTWKCFRRWAEGRRGIEVPNNGCLSELRELFSQHKGLRESLIEDIRNAPGDRTMTIYHARHDGWWPPESAVEDIRNAPASVHGQSILPVVTVGGRRNRLSRISATRQASV